MCLFSRYLHRSREDATVEVQRYSWPVVYFLWTAGSVQPVSLFEET